MLWTRCEVSNTPTHTAIHSGDTGDRIFWISNFWTYFMHIFTNSSYTFYTSLQKAKWQENEFETKKNWCRNYVLKQKIWNEMNKLHEQIATMGRIWSFIVKKKVRVESEMGNLKSKYSWKSWKFWFEYYMSIIND